MHEFFFKLDHIWSGKTQLTASLFFKLSDNQQISYQLAIFRVLVICFSLCELIGSFYITMGLFVWEPIAFLVIGIILKIVGGLANSLCQNRAGILWSLELQSCLKNLKTHSQEISSLLVEKGCSEAEVHALYGLPSEVYQSELNGYRHVCLLNFGTPLVCGLALFLNGEAIIAIIVIILGLLSFPIGEYFFREHTFRQEEQMRIGRSAQLIPYLQHIFQEHLNLTLRVNFLSQIPLLLFGVRFLWNGMGQLLPIFYGLTQGLICLSGTLAFQRSRAQTLRITQNATHLIEILNNKALIVTPFRWHEHQLNSVNIPFEKKEEVANGVAFINFSANFIAKVDGHSFLPPMTCCIPSGSVCLIQAPSGRGKSTFLAALLHLIEHTGDFYFIESFKWINIHLLNQKDFAKSVFFIKEENIEKTARLVDVFRDVFTTKLSLLKQEMIEEFGLMTTNLAWNAADNLIEQEIYHIEEGTQQSVFDRKILPMLKTMRVERSAILQDLLKKGGGNLATAQMYPERTFASLSSGEKKRLLVLLSLEMALTSQVKLIILDEPLAHLDKESIQLQIHTIRQLQQTPHAPSLLLISHLFLDELFNQLNQVQIIKMND